MKIVTLHLICLWFVCVGGVVPCAGQEAPLDLKALLRQSMEATNNLPFTGQLIFHRRAQDQRWRTATQVQRLPSGDKRMEITYPEAAQGIVMLHDKTGLWRTPLNEEVRKTLDQDQKVDMEIFLRAYREKEILNLSRLERLGLLFKNYNITFENNEKFADRDAFQIKITGKAPHRPAVKIWIDCQTKMQLKYVRFTPDGTFEESFFFESIDLQPNFSQSAFSTEGLDQFFSYNAAKEEQEPDLDFTPIEPPAIPAGFVLRSNHRWKRGEGLVQHSVYTDGMAFLSLFQRRQTEQEIQKQKEEECSSDTIKVFERRGTKVYMREINGFRYSMVGDIAADEIYKMLSSIPATPKK
ncbi:MAG: sigma-E factor regulatory protein RseB domain-containing protein [bacterium]|jgi:hypothetical protein|nr:sigma-E factor regulatory protein RseB domain-containing protein [bacterium]